MLILIILMSKCTIWNCINLTLISLIDLIKKYYFACRTFIDLQKTFDTFDHDILIAKPSHYGTRCE